MNNTKITDNNFLKLLIVVLVFMIGWLVGSNNKQSFVGKLHAEPLGIQAPSPSIDYKRMYVYGNYYIVFTQSNGGMFVIKE